MYGPTNSGDIGDELENRYRNSIDAIYNRLANIENMLNGIYQQQQQRISTSNILSNLLNNKFIC